MSETLVITGLVRFSYANVFTPKAIGEGGKEKYSVSLLIPKSDKKTIAKIEAAVNAALEVGKHKAFNGKIPNKAALKLPLRDGDIEREDDENYAGHFFINANSDNPPSVVDRNLDPILDKNEFYSGCYGRASINLYAFNTNGNKGVACGLNNLQKLKDGESLGGTASSAEDDFAEPLEDDLTA